jgi:hypothetical protein
MKDTSMTKGDPLKDEVEVDFNVLGVLMLDGVGRYIYVNHADVLTTTDSNITAGPSLPDCIGPAVINLHYRFKL